MAFKLTKKELATRDELVAKLREKKEALEGALTTYNEAVKEAFGAVETARDEYNEVLADVQEFAHDVAANADGEWENKSEKWQDSERGSAARDWINEWEQASFEEIEIAEPEEIEAGELDHDETLEGLPEAMEG